MRNKLETLTLGVSVVFITTLLIFIILIGLKQHTEPITVYTPEDIIYINYRTVTFEVSEDTLTFDTQHELNTFISDITAKHSTQPLRD